MALQRILVAILTLVLVVIFNSALAEKCYQCNSFHEKACYDLVGEIEPYLLECGNNTGCRKIFQDVGGEERIIRQCSSVGDIDQGCVQRAGTKAIKMTYCECQGKGCNTAQTTSISLGLACMIGFCSVLAALIDNMAS